MASKRHIDPKHPLHPKHLWNWIITPGNPEQRTANGTVVIAAFTVVLAGVSTFQGCELIRSRGDTERMLTSLETQAKAQTTAAEEARSQSLALTKVSEEAKRQADAAKRYAEIAKDQAAALLVQARASEAQNELRLRPIVAFRTRTVTEGDHQADYIFIENTGLGPGMNIVTRAIDAPQLVFLHRILLGAGQEERVSVRENDREWKTQQELTEGLIRLNTSVTVCIAYVNAVGHKYQTWQKFYVLPSKTDFGIDVLQKSAPCQ